ncbi:MAG: hypothetical protein M1816_007024 [Peltula sp. TS41687]|nr:MAG: hypothetical protein M1816_007024 [Peltula sp. TS41687]
MACRHGVLKTYRLTYESAEVLHALFDRQSAINRWKITSSLLKEFNEHFGPKTEQLDIYPENGRCILTSFTEKITNGKEVLKQPLYTSVAVDTVEFEEFSVEDKLHVAISVKDFRAVVLHADTLGISVSAQYSRPSRPMQLSYSRDGMACHFTLMTTGYFQGGTAAPAPLIAPGASMGSTRQEIKTTDTAEATASPVRSLPARPRTEARDTLAEQRARRPSQAFSKTTIEYDSLFFPEQDDDRRWNDDGLRHEEEGLLGWDASANIDAMSRNFDRRMQDQQHPGPDNNSPGPDDDSHEQRIVAPTQRISQVRGIFDDL